MTDQTAPTGTASGWAYLALAAFVALVGGIVLMMDDGPPRAVGVLFVAVGSVIGMIGSVAVGVTVGLLRADEVRNAQDATKRPATREG